MFLLRSEPLSLSVPDFYKHFLNTVQQESESYPLGTISENDFPSDASTI